MLVPGGAPPGFNAGAGWNLGFGRLLAPGTFDNDTSAWVFVSGDGARHPLYSALHEGETETPGVLFSRDGTYVRLKDVAGNAKDLELPDGTVYRFLKSLNPLHGNQIPATDREWLLHEMKDRFGNWVRIDYRNHKDESNVTNWTRWEIYDRHRGNQAARTPAHLVEFTATGNDHYPRVVNKVTLAAFGGGAAVYDFSSEEVEVGPGCPHDFAPGYPTSSQIYLLTEVKLPDATTFSMPLADYKTPPPATCSQISGQILGMTLPTLGRLEWRYTGYRYPRPEEDELSLPYDGVREYETTTGVGERRELDRHGGVLGV